MSLLQDSSVFFSCFIKWHKYGEILYLQQVGHYTDMDICDDQIYISEIKCVEKIVISILFVSVFDLNISFTNVNFNDESIIALGCFIKILRKSCRSEY